MGNKSSAEIHKQKDNEGSLIDRGKQIELLVSGYIRDKEKQWGLLIPDGISQIIYQLYPLLLFRFGDFKEGLFTVNDNRTVIKGTNSMKHRNCCGHLVYADLGNIYNNVGLGAGVHLWSIKFCQESSSCFASIGVTSIKNNELINEWGHDGTAPSQHWIDIGYNSFYHGCSKWRKSQVITVKLDCDHWTVKYYKDTEKKEFQNDNIEPNKSYYFALMVCNDERWTNYKVVDSYNAYYP